jgi:hypothetical protein
MPITTLHTYIDASDIYGLAEFIADSGSVANVSTRSAMLALDRASTRLAVLTEAGREGSFEAVTSDLSGKVMGSALASTAVVGNTITIPNNGLDTGLAVLVTTAANGLAVNTIYWVIQLYAKPGGVGQFQRTDNIQLASTWANAQAGTPITLTGTAAVTLKEHKDPRQGKYVLPASDLSGASGGWVREGFVELGHCGLADAATGGFSGAWQNLLTLGFRKPALTPGSYIATATVYARQANTTTSLEGVTIDNQVSNNLWIVFKSWSDGTVIEDGYISRATPSAPAPGGTTFPDQATIMFVADHCQADRVRIGNFYLAGIIFSGDHGTATECDIDGGLLPFPGILSLDGLEGAHTWHCGIVFDPKSRGGFDLHGNKIKRCASAFFAGNYASGPALMPGVRSSGNFFEECLDHGLYLNGVYDATSTGDIAFRCRLPIAYKGDGGAIVGLVSGTDRLTGPHIWLRSKAYIIGDQSVANGNLYQATVAGTSAATGAGPTGTGTGIVDGTVTWDYVSVAPAIVITALDQLGAIDARDCRNLTVTGCSIKGHCSNGQEKAIALYTPLSVLPLIGNKVLGNAIECLSGEATGVYVTTPNGMENNEVSNNTYIGGIRSLFGAFHFAGVSGTPGKGNSARGNRAVWKPPGNNAVCIYGSYQDGFTSEGNTLVVSEDGAVTTTLYVVDWFNVFDSKIRDSGIYVMPGKGALVSVTAYRERSASETRNLFDGLDVHGLADAAGGFIGINPYFIDNVAAMPRVVLKYDGAPSTNASFANVKRGSEWVNRLGTSSTMHLRTLTDGVAWVQIAPPTAAPNHWGERLAQTLITL